MKRFLQSYFAIALTIGVSAAWSEAGAQCADCIDGGNNTEYCIYGPLANPDASTGCKESSSGSSCMVEVTKCRDVHQTGIYKPDGRYFASVKTAPSPETLSLLAARRQASVERDCRGRIQEYRIPEKVALRKRRTLTMITI